MEPGTEHVTDGESALPRLGARALGYQRSVLLLPGGLPAGWEEVRAVGVVGSGAEVFDAAAEELFSLSAHERAGTRMARADPEQPDDVVILEGPLRGPCRIVDRTDESLCQGLVVGTLEGSPAVAEHRCHVDLDPATGAVTVTVRTAWRPSRAYLLPGAGRREMRAYRKMGERLVRAVGVRCAAGSGVVGA